MEFIRFRSGSSLRCPVQKRPGFRLRGRGSNFAFGGGFPMPRRVNRDVFACFMAQCDLLDLAIGGWHYYVTITNKYQNNLLNHRTIQNLQTSARTWRIGRQTKITKVYQSGAVKSLLLGCHRRLSSVDSPIFLDQQPTCCKKNEGYCGHANLKNLLTSG